MRFISLKYVWILAIFLSLSLKVGSMLRCSDDLSLTIEKEWSSGQKDAGEEKKVETDFFINDLAVSYQVLFFLPSDVKLSVPGLSHIPDYFPEVNTPPPAM